MLESLDSVGNMLNGERFVAWIVFPEVPDFSVRAVASRNAVHTPMTTTEATTREFRSLLRLKKPIVYTESQMVCLIFDKFYVSAGKERTTPRTARSKSTESRLWTCKHTVEKKKIVYGLAMCCGRSLQ